MDVESAGEIFLIWMFILTEEAKTLTKHPTNSPVAVYHFIYFRVLFLSIRASIVIVFIELWY